MKIVQNQVDTDSNGIRLVKLCLTGLLLCASGTQAQPLTEPGNVITIELSNFNISPNSLVLEHGHSYRLRLVNRSPSSHDFSATSFFRSAKLEAEDRRKFKGEKIELRGRQEVEISIVPQQPGHYKFHCTHPFHAALGMRGSIDVR